MSHIDCWIRLHTNLFFDRREELEVAEVVEPVGEVDRRHDFRHKSDLVGVGFICREKYTQL